MELTNVVRLGRDETYEHLDDHGDELLLIKNYGSPPWSSKCSYTNALAYSFGESAEHKFSLNNPPKGFRWIIFSGNVYFRNKSWEFGGHA